MQLGIFAKTFKGASPEIVLSTAKKSGYECVQYNMACSGLNALPAMIETAAADQIAVAADKYKIVITAVSATYNMVHPNLAKRLAGRKSFAEIAANAKRMGTNMLTVCTGSCDPLDQWHHHPDNNLPSIWNDLCHECESLLEIADQYGIAIGIEPELANIVNNANRARALLDQFKSPRLKIILDPANLFEIENDPERRKIIENAIDLLASDIAFVHAKDRNASGGFATTGQGVIDFAHYFKTLKRAGFDGPVITHGLSESEAPSVAQYLRERMSQ